MDTVLIRLNSFNFPLKGSVSIEETIKVQGERESRNKEDYSDYKRVNYKIRDIEGIMQII